MSAVYVQVAIYLGSGPLDPPAVRLVCRQLNFLPKGRAIVSGGTDPAQRAYQLSLHSSRSLGRAGVVLRDWLRSHSLLGGFFIEQHRIMLGVRYLSDADFDPQSAASALLHEVQGLVSNQMFPAKTIDFSDPQFILYPELVDPRASTS